MGAAARVKPFRVRTPRACQDFPTSWPAAAPRRRRGWPLIPAARRVSRPPWVAPRRGHPRRPPPAGGLVRGAVGVGST